MEKVQANNPGSIRTQPTVAATKKTAGQEGAPALETGSQRSNPSVEGGKRLPSTSVQRQDAAAAKDQQQVQDAANKVNEYAKQQQREVRFSVDQELGRPVVKVVDSSRDVVVRQIPSEVVIRLARNLEEYMEYSELSGATPSPDAELSDVAAAAADVSGLAQGIEPGQLINTNV